VFVACIHLVISGELTPEERVRVAEYGLAMAIITFWIRAHAPADQRVSETRRGEVAGAATTETLQTYIFTLVIIIGELSQIAQPIRGGVLGTMPADHLFALVRRLSRTDQRAEALENGFEWSILRALCRSDLGVSARLIWGASGS
jgi:hypothetical protein